MPFIIPEGFMKFLPVSCNAAVTDVHRKMAQEKGNLLDKLESEHADPLNKSYLWEVWTLDGIP